MSIALLSGMTLTEFLDWEERQELAYEFNGLQPEAMTGGTHNHAAIQAMLITALGTRLRGTPCRVFGSHLQVLVDGSVRYPDAMIRCGRADATATFIDDPVVVFEIVSPSTEPVDRIIKSAEYRNAPSIQAYVMLQQDFVGATVLRRTRRVNFGRLTPMARARPSASPAIGIDLPVDELYEGLDLPA